MPDDAAAEAPSASEPSFGDLQELILRVMRVSRKVPDLLKLLQDICPHADVREVMYGDDRGPRRLCWDCGLRAFGFPRSEKDEDGYLWGGPLADVTTTMGSYLSMESRWREFNPPKCTPNGHREDF